MENKRKEKIWNLVQYGIMVMLVLGQVTIGKNYLLGQGFYLIGNVFSLVKCFQLKRPKAEKVNFGLFTTMTTALMFF